MKVSEVKSEEMKACADLLHFLKSAEITIKMNQAELLFNGVVWLQSLAREMVLSNTEKDEKPISTEKASLPLSNVKIHKAKK